MPHHLSRVQRPREDKSEDTAPKNSFKRGFPYLGFSILFFTCLLSIAVVALYANIFITIALVIACLISVIALIREFKDEHVQTLDALERLTNLPVLGVIPKSKQRDPMKIGMMSQSEPRSTFAEAYRLLRTNLMFSTPQGVPRTLAITSAMSLEGKSSIAINIATVLSQSGKAVLLIDADLRNPSIHHRLRLDNSRGLTSYLTGQEHVENVTQSCQIPDVYVITVGPMSPNPVELLSSERLDQLFKLAKPDIFDTIILDLPPMGGLADSFIVAARADATILAVSIHDTKEEYVINSIKKLNYAQANIVGTVATKVKLKYLGMQGYDNDSVHLRAA